MKVTITVDFGMTGSAAEWWRSDNTDDGTPHLIGKIPTKLAYGENGNLTAWGHGCAADMIRGTNWTIYKNFKNAWTTSRTEDGQRRAGANSDTDAERLISDYLRQFSGQIIEEITRKENINQRELIIAWHFTTPGSWNAAARRDFKILCFKVFSDLSPNPEITVDLTEAQASCEYLTNALKPVNGTWMITLDIGGATIDFALAVVKTEDGLIVPEAYPFTGQGTAFEVGVTDIDVEFERWASGFQLMGTELVESHWWEQARHSFDGSKEVSFVPYPQEEISRITSPTHIPILTMYAFYTQFMQQFKLELGRAIKITQGLSLPEKPIIALCGGGGVMKAVPKWLSMAFNDYKIILPPSAEESCFATITGHRLYLKRRTIKLFLEEVEIGFSGALSTDPIRWKNPTRVTTCNFRSRKEVVTHYFIMKGNLAARPSSVRYLDEGLGPWPGTSVWVLHVNLGLHWIQDRKYCIEAICTGKGRFEFRIHDTESPGEELEFASRVLIAGE